MSFDGTWIVVSSPDFDDDYLHEEGEPYVRLQQRGSRVEGEYHIGLQSGGIDGRLQGENRIRFSFEGMDEMDVKFRPIWSSTFHPRSSRGFRPSWSRGA